MNTQTNAEKFRIYVADLAAYNEGLLIGRWFVPSEYRDADELEAAVTEAMSNANNEHAIHDSENVRISEHESLEAIIAAARACHEWGCDKVQAAIDHGIATELENMGDAIGEHDGGEYRSKEEWAQEYIDSAYDLEKMLGNLANDPDFEAFARDAELGGDVSFVELSAAGVRARGSVRLRECCLGRLSDHVARMRRRNLCAAWVSFWRQPAARKKENVSAMSERLVYRARRWRESVVEGQGKLQADRARYRE